MIVLLNECGVQAVAVVIHVMCRIYNCIDLDSGQALSSWQILEAIVHPSKVLEDHGIHVPSNIGEGQLVFGHL